jgi:ATP-dependent Lhr-like helicase
MQRLFHPAVQAWFRDALGEPTRAQTLAWPAIARGDSTLLLAPTGSGKTLAAFLVAIDRLLRDPPRAKKERARVLYVSPMKALAVDVDRNLRAPIEGITAEAERLGHSVHVPTIDVRTGDTPARDRARMARRPADVIITTPESLYLLLTSSAREVLRSIETVIVDEIHALVASKRGAHLALSLERLEALRSDPHRTSPRPGLQRIGLSATQRPLDEVARLLGGFDRGAPRKVTIVDAGVRKELVLTVEAPWSRASPGGGGQLDSAWPSLHQRVVDLVRVHRSTIVFVNSRRLAERLAAAVNDVAGEELALAHHGSLAREKRAAIEDRLKRGELPAIVATSSLELGIDMGAVDLVVLIESPPSVAAGLQRVGRASHGVTGVPHGVLLPKHRHDLLACATATASMRAGDVEETFYPRNPLDVLAQQVVAMVSIEPLAEADLFERVRCAAPFADLPRPAFESVLDMLSGRYPSSDFAELRPRLTWDRLHGRLEARAGSHRLAVVNAGTIPDRGLYGVFTAGGEDSRPRRVGELDEEMVFELREGEVFLLGASSWRAEQITHERVVVTPAAGEPGKMPFWHGDRPGRSRAFGKRIGALVRDVASGASGAKELRRASDLDASSASAIVSYVGEQVAATGEVPSDRGIVVERFLDEVGDWRVVILCPLGMRVLAPWALAVSATLRARYVEIDQHCTDDGIAFRIPASDDAPPTELFFPPADDIEARVARALDGTAVFAARFRECATRALLLPRRDPRRRTPLWAQRKRARDLLAVAARHPSFPIVLETYRECLRDAFDLPGLAEALRDVASRRVRVTTVDTRKPSPFASNVLFAFVANFIYEADAPPGERRAQALTIDFARLRELLGDAELRQLLDPEVIRDHEAWLQHLSRPATTRDAVQDLLLAVGDLSGEELAARCSPPEKAGEWARELMAGGRAVELPFATGRRYAAVEDAARYRDALGMDLPPGLPPALLVHTADAMTDLVKRFARTRGPFLTRDAEHRFGEGSRAAVALLLREGRLIEGALLPGGTEPELCDRDVLETLRRRSLARLRRAIEPVDARTLSAFLLEWQGVTRRRRGRDALLAVVSELQGCPLVASSLDTEILPARVDGYRPWDLDALCAAGEVVWAGLEPLGTNDGRIALYLPSDEALLARPIVSVEGKVAASIREVLGSRGASFFVDVARQVGGFPSEVLDTLWRMVWAGEVTNDTLEPLRSRARDSAGSPRHPRAPRTGPGGSEGRWSLRQSRWSPDRGRHVPGSAGAWSNLGAGDLDTERRAAIARALLGRYGVVMRETAHAEGIAGGFAVVYDVLKTMEEQGRVRRGYFVEGRGGAQFALPGADERLRAVRSEVDGTSPASPGRGRNLPAGASVVLAATDPANAWGAVLEWPASSGEARPQRAAGAVVVLHDGTLVGWMGRGENPLLTFLPDAEPERTSRARALADALASLVDRGLRPALLISTVDGQDAARSALAPIFVAARFSPSAQGLLKRRAEPRGEGGDTEVGREPAR